MNPLVTVYLGERRAIVAPTHATPEGILYEQDAPIVLPGLSPADVGLAVKRAFSLFSVRPKDLRLMKPSDWPSFQASGYSTIKKFESDFCRISVFYLNPSGAIARASLPIPCDSEYEIATSFNPYLEGIVVGTKILGLLDRMKSKMPNKAPEPTTMAVTSPAAQEPRQP